MVQLADTRRSERRAHYGLGSSTLPLVTAGGQAPDWLSYGRFARIVTGTCNCERRRWASAQRSLIRSDSQVRHLDRPFRSRNGVHKYHKASNQSCGSCNSTERELLGFQNFHDVL